MAIFRLESDAYNGFPQTTIKVKLSLYNRIFTGILIIVGNINTISFSEDIEPSFDTF